MRYPGDRIYSAQKTNLKRSREAVLDIFSQGSAYLRRKNWFSALKPKWKSTYRFFLVLCPDAINKLDGVSWKTSVVASPSWQWIVCSILWLAIKHRDIYSQCLQTPRNKTISSKVKRSFEHFDWCFLFKEMRRRSFYMNPGTRLQCFFVYCNSFERRPVAVYVMILNYNSG